MAKKTKRKRRKRVEEEEQSQEELPILLKEAAPKYIVEELQELPLQIQAEVKEYIDANKIESKEDRDKVFNTVRSLFNNSVYDPEETIGVVTAQSLSEPATQLTMRTYHFAGTAGIQVTLGLPRMLEIFDARKEPRTPTMTIYIQKDRQNLDEIKRIAENIKEVKVRDVVLFTTLDLTDVKIKCKFDIPKVKRLGIELDSIPKNLKIRNVDMEVERDNIVISPKKKDLKLLHKLKYFFLDSHLKGIKGVTQAVITKEGDEWVITTLGSNLKKVFATEGVDHTRTTSNNIYEILDVLGVEAARNAIIEQASFTLEEQGMVVDKRYIMLLADLMTFEGVISAIGRYGISGEKASVLVRASFEETKKHLVSAAVRGEVDNLKGTIENIMMNQVAPIGTGAFDLVASLPPPAKKK